MIGLTSLLMTVLTLPVAEEDTIRTERLEEVVVTSNSARQRIQNVQTGAEVIQIEDLTSAPQLFGQADIMRSIQLLPGVKAESDASSSFQVRGGTSAQNQVLFDLAPVYNSGHLAGLFSAFNEDALASATLYKGLLPAQYGGASSAVLDITGRTGNRGGWHGGASVGLLSAKGTLEGPIAKDKASLLVTARRTYMDLLLKASKDFKDNTLYFYDVNVKLDWTINAKNQMYLTFFTSHDRTSVDKMADIRWGNLTANLKWLHHFKGDSYAQTTAYLSNYETDNGVDFLRMNLWYKGHIRQMSLRQDFSIHIPSTGDRSLLPLTIRAGLQTSLWNVKSAEWQVLNKYDKEQRRAWENTAWVNGTFDLRSDLQASVGLRVNAFMPLGGSLYYDIERNGDIGWYYNYGKNQIVKTHLTLEPRASISWQPTPQTSIKLGYARTSQNLHALRNQSTSTPFDRYTMSSNIVKPETADQWSGGFYLMTPRQDYDFSIEGYYRQIRDVLDYKDGKSFSSEIEIERLVLAGEGKSYGVELCARKNSGRLTGWIGYTLSWSKTRIDGINGGQWYDANNDRRHDINIVGMYRLNDRWTFNAAWVFNSGQAFTAPSGKYQVIDNWIYYYAERNGYRAPDYHHLDVSAVYKRGTRKEERGRRNEERGTRNEEGGMRNEERGKRGRRRVETEWVFGIYNIYNRYNPYLINFEDSENGARTKAKQYSLFGIVPSVAFNVRF